jgi:hypothetical protein
MQNFSQESRFGRAALNRSSFSVQNPNLRGGWRRRGKWDRQFRASFGDRPTADRGAIMYITRDPRDEEYNPNATSENRQNPIGSGKKTSQKKTTRKTGDIFMHNPSPGPRQNIAEETPSRKPDQGDHMAPP